MLENINSIVWVFTQVILVIGIIALLSSIVFGNSITKRYYILAGAILVAFGLILTFAKMLFGLLTTLTLLTSFMLIAVVALIRIYRIYRAEVLDFEVAGESSEV